MFLPILLSLGLLGASATSVGNGNCPTDAELLQPFTQTSESFDLTWFQNAKKECANGNCKDVARTIFSVADQTKNNFEDRFWFARFSLECRNDWSSFGGRCVDYNMPTNEANDVISSYGGFNGLGASKQKLLKKRNELLYRVGWYNEPAFEECNKVAEESKTEVADVPESVEKATPLEEPYYPQDSFAINEVENGVNSLTADETTPVVDVAPTGIAGYDNYLAREGMLSVEGTTPVAEEAPETWVDEQTPVVEETIETQASLFAQKQKSNNIMLKVLTNTLETYSDTVEETALAVEETPESPVEEPTTI